MPRRTFTLSLFLFCFISHLSLTQVYKITDLGPLAPTAINTWGEVVGDYNGHAFMWAHRGGLRDLGIMPGGTFSRAAAINDLGVVAGTADGHATVVSPFFPDGLVQCRDLVQPFVWTRATGMHGLGAPRSYPFGWPTDPCNLPNVVTDMNAFGQVVGYTGVYSDDQWGFFWTTAGGMSVFGGSWPPTFVSGVNNRGQIVGQNSAFPTFGIGHGTSWEHDVATDLGTLGGGAEVVDYSSAANGVNDLGQIVGWSTISPISFAGWLESSVHAVLWSTAGGIRDLGTLPGDTLSAASKINFFGKVIGSSGNTAVFPWFVTESSPYEVIGRPFIWSQRNGMRDLNTLIPVNSGWVLSSASDINIWGQIVGSGMLNGQPHGFLLTPRGFLKNGR